MELKREQLLLRPNEAAAALAISPRTLWALTADHRIPHLRIGRLVRYRVEAVAEWLAAKENGGDVL